MHECENPKPFTFSQPFGLFSFPLLSENLLTNCFKQRKVLLFRVFVCEICIYVYMLECGWARQSNSERGKFLWKSWRAKSGQFLDGLPAGLLKGFEKKSVLPLPWIRPDCDVAQAATNLDCQFPFLFILLWPQKIFISLLVQPCILREERKALHFLVSFFFAWILRFHRWIFKPLRTSAS